MLSYMLSDTYWAVKSQKMGRGLKLQVLEVEGLLRHSLSAPLFLHMQKAGFLTTLLIFKTLVGLCVLSTGLPHYNSPHYNTDFNITRSGLGSQMGIFLLF